MAKDPIPPPQESVPGLVTPVDHADVADDRLFEIQERCEEFIRLLRDGVAPSQAEFAAQFPGYEAEILELLPAIVLMEGARGRNFQKRKDGRVQRGPEEIVQLGDYLVIHELGRGGMGIVYEAQQASLDRRVALKVLPKHSLTPIQVDKFFLEASTAAKLHHTNIAPIYDVGTHDGFHYFSMQLLKGTSLETYVQSSSDSSRFQSEEDELDVLSVPDVVDIGRQVASALQYAHNQGVYHRDIKPANLVRDSAANVWVTDFGLAVTHGQQGIQSDAYSGTLRYMPPEKFRSIKTAVNKENGSLFDREGDVYALGVTMIELLAGRAAFPSLSVVELVEDVSTGRMIDLQNDGRPLPSDLEAVLLKSVATDPTLRYRTIAEFAADLENYSESRPVNAIQTNWIGKTLRWIKRNLALAIVSALATYLVVVVSVISTGSFFNTQSQINIERLRRLRSEESVLNASKSFLNTFEPYADATVFGDGKISSQTNSATVTQPVVSMLEKMSREYVELSEQSPDLPKLAADSNRALCIVAELQMLMGDYEAARVSLQSSLNDLKKRASEAPLLDEETTLAAALRNSPFSTESILQLAKVNNQLAVALANSRFVDTELARSRLDESRNLHVTALKSLEPVYSNDSQNPIVMLELARTLYLLGRSERIGYRPGDFPTGKTIESTVSNLSNRRAWINRAILILESNNQDNEYSDARLHLLALCRVEKWKILIETNPDNQEAAATLNSARDRLGKLIKAYPNVDRLSSDMISALVESNSLLDSMKRALVFSEVISNDAYVLPIYQMQQIQLHRDLAQACVEAGKDKGDDEKPDLISQEESHRRRVLQAHLLLATHRSRTHNASIKLVEYCHQIWTAKFSLELASCPGLKDRLAERNKLIGDAVGILHKLPKEILERPNVEAIMQEAKRMSRKSLFN